MFYAARSCTKNVSDIQIREHNSKLSLQLYFIVSHLGANSLGNWKVGERSE